MNKYQEAYEFIEGIAGKEDVYIPFSDMDEAIKPIKELVDKATPRKPIEISHIGLYGWACPSCANCVSNYPKRGHDKIKFCYSCGQALDWSEEDE